MLDRRSVLAAVASTAAAGLFGGCAQRFDNLRLWITTGSSAAVYNQLGTVLANRWSADLGIPAPIVLTSVGSGQNLDRLLDGQADIGFSAADAAAARLTSAGGAGLRALARMHDDCVQIVVPAEGPVRTLADLRGLRVSIGAVASGVQLIADRLLAQVGLTDTIRREQLTVEHSADALANGDIDAFFWSGGIPTSQITALTRRMPIRLVDLADILPSICTRYREYGNATIPASAYRLPKAVTTLLVRNFLLVTDQMADDVAEALTRATFAAQPTMAAANAAARTIDLRGGIETMPVPLHNGALAYYRTNSW